MNLNIRRTRPTSGNKYYNTKSKGGYSTCIVGKPTDSQCNILSNCVGNACAGFNEEHNFGYEKYHLNCNAENFVERAIASGLSVFNEPMVGGILVWRKGATLSGSDGAGHVEVVTDILERDSKGKPTKIRTHSSGYGNSNPWWTTIRSIGNGNWGCNSPYAYRGCIAPEGYVPSSTPSQPTSDIDSKSVDELAKEVIAGKYGNGEERKNALGSRYSEVQKRVNEMLSNNNSKPEPSPAPTVDILTLVKKTIRGDFGNGEARKKALGSNYNEVQHQVNLNVQHGTTRWDNIRLY